MRALFEKNLQRMLNGYLALDPESEYRLHALEGRCITMELNGLAFIFQLFFQDKKIIFLTKNFNSPDTIIKGTPLTLLSMMLTKKNRHTFFADDVIIEGNLELGQHVIDLFDTLEIHWEDYLSRITGDVPAYQMGRFAKKIKQFASRTRQSFTQSLNEYIHEEIDLFPPREALNDFFHDVDVLRMDADRLEAKIALLSQKIAEKRGIS
jgi:ubiquinone biosynthesis protein UbiJ